MATNTVRSLVVVTPTITVSTQAYSAGNNVGGLLDLGNLNAEFPTLGKVILQSVHVADHANQKAALQALLFPQQPAGTFTDGSAFPTLSGPAAAASAAIVLIAAADYTTVGGAAFATEKNLGIEIALAGPHVWVAINTSGTPTYGATSDLTLTFGFEQGR